MRGGRADDRGANGRDGGRAADGHADGRGLRAVAGRGSGSAVASGVKPRNSARSFSRTATGAALAWVLSGCSAKPAERFLLPDGYAGWVPVTFNVSDASRFPREDGFRLVTVPDTGKVSTSELPLYGE